MRPPDFRTSGSQLMSCCTVENIGTKLSVFLMLTVILPSIVNTGSFILKIKIILGLLVTLLLVLYP